MKFTMTYELSDGREWENTWEMVMPFTVFMSYTGEPVTRKAQNIAFCVPIDDTHQIGAGIRCVSPNEDEGKSHADYGPLAEKAIAMNTHRGIQTIRRHRKAKGPIAIHALEHLVTSDQGVILFRKILRESIRAVREGRDPKGIIRNPENAKCVQTVAASVVK